MSQPSLPLRLVRRVLRVAAKGPTSFPKNSESQSYLDFLRKLRFSICEPSGQPGRRPCIYSLAEKNRFVLLLSGENQTSSTEDAAQ